MIKKIYSFFLIVLVLVTSPFLIRYLLANQKITILNSIYFNFPGIITKNKICPTYDALLNQTLDDSFSVSIINNKGEIISSYNEDVPRLPASNQKLFSSAYVLSKYKLNNNLKTSLFKNKNDYYLHGQGDPDLNYENIIELISNVKENKIINFNIVEIDSKLYWPNGWTNTDKLYEYGSPITSLAIESNHNKYLSRKNKITTKLVVLFLDKMRYFNDFKAYQSTLSITGVRGTLAKRFVNSELSGKFFGKTGTLSNVFALSGFLYKNEKPIIISIIQNSNKIDKEKAFKLLRDLYYLKSC